MRPYLVVTTHVRQQDVTEVALAEHNNVVKAFPSDRTDQPFGISILPRGARRRRPIADAYRSEPADIGSSLSDRYEASDHHAAERLGSWPGARQVDHNDFSG